METITNEWTAASKSAGKNASRTVTVMIMTTEAALIWLIILIVIIYCLFCNDGKGNGLLGGLF